MSYRIAITGKGGTGKTTIAALTVLRLIARGCTPVLAVDADPNTCLDAALGVSVSKSVGTVREEARQIAQKGMAAGAGKQQLLEMKIAESLVEGTDFDLIAMGRSEGPGCYCYANNVLKAVMSELAGSYRCMVLDNEAGLENLSRRIAPEVDLLVMVSDASARGLKTVERLHSLTKEMGVTFGRLVLIVNRCRGGVLPEGAGRLAERIGAVATVALPEDEHVAMTAERGESLKHLDKNSPLAAMLDAMLDKVM